MTATTRRDGFVHQRKPIIPTTIDTYKYDTVRYTYDVVITLIWESIRTISHHNINYNCR